MESCVTRPLRCQLLPPPSPHLHLRSAHPELSHKTIAKQTTQSCLFSPHVIRIGCTHVAKHSEISLRIVLHFLVLFSHIGISDNSQIWYILLSGTHHPLFVAAVDDDCTYSA